MNKVKEPKYKIGDVVNNRIIVEVIPCIDYGGKYGYRYGYRYENEPEDIYLMWCSESTLIRSMS